MPSSKPHTAATCAGSCTRAPPPSDTRLSGEQAGQEEECGNRPIQKHPQRNGNVTLGQAVDEHNGSDSSAAHGLEVAVFRHDESSPPRAPDA